MTPPQIFNFLVIIGIGLYCAFKDGSKAANLKLLVASLCLIAAQILLNKFFGSEQLGFAPSIKDALLMKHMISPGTGLAFFGYCGVSVVILSKLIGKYFDEDKGK